MGDGAAEPPGSSLRPLRTLFKDLRVISFEQFQQYADDGHTLIPVVREVLSDLDTPLSVYLKLADGPYTYLFESVEGGERFGRYSIIGPLIAFTHSRGIRCMSPSWAT